MRIVLWQHLRFLLRKQLLRLLLPKQLQFLLRQHVWIVLWQHVWFLLRQQLRTHGLLSRLERLLRRLRPRGLAWIPRRLGFSLIPLAGNRSAMPSHFRPVPAATM